MTRGCVEARRRFYAWPSILRRSLGNRSDGFMFRNFFPINAMHRNEVSLRNGYPLGDEAERAAEGGAGYQAEPETQSHVESAFDTP